MGAHELLENSTTNLVLHDDARQDYIDDSDRVLSQDYDDSLISAQSISCDGMLDGVISTNYEGNPTMKNATLTRKTTNAKCMICGKTRKEQLRELPTFNTAEDNDGNIVQVTRPARTR